MLPEDEDYAEDDEHLENDLDDDSDDDDSDDDDSDDDDSDDDDSDDDDSEEPSEDLVRRAQAVKARRLFVEDRGRQPHSASEIHFFVMSSDCERPIEPEECDFDVARKAEADERG